MDAETIEDVTVQQYFDRSTPFALLSALVVAAAIVLWLCTSTRLVQADRQLLTLAIVWLVIPTALIIICSAFVHPIYTPRYLCFTAPAVALVLGVCIGALALSLGHGWRWPSLVSLLSPQLPIIFSCNAVRMQNTEWTTAKWPI